ncbi:hypothetical protein EVAR_78174_1 [Eumeta japonica]|uniref:Uncharacterized protein n=1 Tax=Eumeta variegata TaxID=151549 RepID=A0A4C1UYQ6_EUMVA|nr:hypothetical protein EVAR_78174_1 [Eumeta japonica]
MSRALLDFPNIYCDYLPASNSGTDSFPDFDPDNVLDFNSSPILDFDSGTVFNFGLAPGFAPQFYSPAPRTAFKSVTATRHASDLYDAETIDRRNKIWILLLGNTVV